MLHNLLQLCTTKLAAASAASKVAFVGGVAVMSMGAAGAAVALPSGTAPNGTALATTATSDPTTDPTTTASTRASDEAAEPVESDSPEPGESAKATPTTTTPRPCPSRSPQEDANDHDGDDQPHG